MFSRLPSEAKDGAGEAEETDQRDQGYEGGDIAQLIAQEIPETKGAGGARFGAWRVHADPIIKRPPTGDPC